jgi:hypothetical protein
MALLKIEGFEVMPRIRRANHFRNIPFSSILPLNISYHKRSPKFVNNSTENWFFIHASLLLPMFYSLSLFTLLA